MLGLSAKARYGLQAAYDLALHAGAGPRQIRDIASGQHIPHQFLEQLLVSLKRAGLVESFRGSRGGYTLAREPAAIRVLEVLTSLDGELSLASGEWADQVLRAQLEGLQSAVADILSVTLADLVSAKRQAESAIRFDI